MNQLQLPDRVLDCRNFVGGQWTSGREGFADVRSPYWGETVGRVYQSSAADVDQAVAAACKAAQGWGRTPIKERSQALFSFRGVLMRDLDRLARSASLECGKTLGEAKAGVLKGIEVLEFALSLQNSDEGGKLEVSRGVTCEYRREPLGVVAGITPFNFPAMVPMWMIPIALALGNAFVWKPSDKTPMTSILLADLAKEAGIPDGVLTVVQGGKQTVEALLDHPGVSAVGFVGSTPVARSVYQRAASRGKRVLALGGAKNHIILMPDADPEMASRGITDSFTGCAGQRCMAASALVAVGDCQPVLDAIVEKSSAIRLGEDMGAIISQESRERLKQAVARAEKEGAQVALDGRGAKDPAAYPGGYWLAPTVLDRVRPGTEAACMELFGPVLSVIRVGTLSEALAIENASPFGNAASVFTQSGAVASRVAAEARAGMVGVNIGVPVPREPFSFGGTNDSKFGQGEITGPGSLGLWSNLKKITTKWAPAKDHNWMS